MSDRRKTWSELSSLQRKAVVVGGIVELGVTTLAARDLYQRDVDLVRGPKVAWLAAFAVQPFGPVAYLLFGRKGPGAPGRTARRSEPRDPSPGPSALLASESGRGTWRRR